ESAPRSQRFRVFHPIFSMEAFCPRLDGACSIGEASSMARGVQRLVGAALLLAGCAGVPTPLAPSLPGSLGLPHPARIPNAVPLPKHGTGFALLRNNGIRYGNPRLVAAIQSAAKEVDRQRPHGTRLIVGDLSARFGGEASGHRSHRTGRDADLLIYITTLDG